MADLIGKGKGKPLTPQLNQHLKRKKMTLDLGEGRSISVKRKLSEYC